MFFTQIRNLWFACTHSPAMPPNITPGSIYWLSEHHTRGFSHHRRAYGHPAIVLDAGHNSVQVCVMTSFGGRNIDEAHPRQSRNRSRYMAVGTTPKFDERPAVQTTDNDVFSEFQYVRIDSPFCVPRLSLRPFGHGPLVRLTKNSMDILMAQLRVIFAKTIPGSIRRDGGGGGKK